MERVELAAGSALVAECRFTDASDGDFRIDAPPPALERRRRRIHPAPWTWLTQVHGANVVAVDRPGGGAGTEADASISSVVGAPLAIQTADCAPVLLAGSGVIGAAHAGWRGLLTGVLDATVTAMRERTDGEISAVVGPHISAAAYEFGAADLQTLVDAYGPSVVGVSSGGTPALDVAAAVRIALGRTGVTDVRTSGGCTGSSARWYSHRVRKDRARQTSVIWLEEPS